MNRCNRIAIAIATIIALSACSEAEMPQPAAEPPTPTVSDTQAIEADLGSPTTVSVPAVGADQNSPPPVDISVKISGICGMASIGGIRGPELNAPVQVKSDTFVSGWRAYQAADGTEAPAWLRVLGHEGAVVFQTPLPATVDRQDVAEALNRPSALRSGFQQVKVKGLPQGSYTLEVVLNAGSQWVRCGRTWQIQVI